MILDDDVRLFFQGRQNEPCAFGGHGSLQIFRGKSASLWKDAHPGGCKRHFIVFNKFGVIPKYCFDCYKVLILPRTVVELFKLLMIFEKMVLPGENTRKCMVEGRSNCSGAYKGFIFCRGMEEGNKVLDFVRKVVADEISPNVPVTLKRGCSEFALAYPMYSPTESGAVFMEYNEDWLSIEDFADQNMVITVDATGGKTEARAQYTPSENFAMRYWISYAATIGDITYLKITGHKVQPIPQLKRPPFTAVDTN